MLVTGEYDPLCPLEDSIEAYGELRAPRELWVMENQFHPMRKMSNLGGMDSHEYIVDWLHEALCGKGLGRDHSRVSYIKAGGDGPWGDCEWTPTVGPGQAYF